MEINTILDQVDLGAMALPEFQRGYVWNGQQVRDLMSSLYRRYPVGGLLVWVTRTDTAEARGDHPLSAGNVRLILDGQQRITSLYGIIRGNPPPFFEGNVRAFSDLFFNLIDETFEFYGPVKMRDNPHWISVTELMKSGPAPFLARISGHPIMASQMETFFERLVRLHGIRNVNLHLEEVTGSDKTVDVVVNIFNKVNSGGTKLSKGDLALARICAEWPDARQELRTHLARWRGAGYHFQMDWLLRNVNTVQTGEALFSALEGVSAGQFRGALARTVKAIDYILNVVSGRLGLDHDRVLGGRYAFPIMTRYVVNNDGRLRNAAERDRLLYWYVQTMLWGRFTGSTESVLNQDLAVMEGQEDALDRLIEQLRIWRGDLTVRAENFSGWSLGARFYPLLYLLTRVGDARDWGTGLPLRAELMGKTNQLQLHHIFPKARLYEHNYLRPDINALANFCFLTQTTNLAIGKRLPSDYFAEIEASHPGALQSQWIPMDRNLWQVENYMDFLAARRALLSNAANEFLESLLLGETSATAPILAAAGAPTLDTAYSVPGGIADDLEEEELLDANIWIADRGLPEGEMLYELTSSDGAEVLAILDLVWVDGLQIGLSEPVALLIAEDHETLELASSRGFRCFTDVESFREYVEQEILAVDVAYS